MQGTRLYEGGQLQPLIERDGDLLVKFAVAIRRGQSEK